MPPGSVLKCALTRPCGCSPGLARCPVAVTSTVLRYLQCAERGHRRARGLNPMGHRVCVLGKRGEDPERREGGEDGRDRRTEEKEAENGGVNRDE